MNDRPRHWKQRHNPLLPLQSSAIVPWCQDGPIVEVPVPVAMILKAVEPRLYREKTSLTCHHLRPAFQGRLVSKPALSILPLIPAPSNRPKTVRRNRVTTNWSRGESRSAATKVDKPEYPWRVQVTYGSNAPLHRLPSRWLYRGLYRREKHRRRWVGFDSDTTASYKTGMAWKGYLGCPCGG